MFGVHVSLLDSKCFYELEWLLVELTYEGVSAWFDRYFKEVVANMGPLETVLQ
jgi:hypothetical protein